MRGQRVQRAFLSDGVEVRLGDVIVLVRDPATSTWTAAGLDAYDAFVDRVDEELVRGKLLGHPTTLLYVRGRDGEAGASVLGRIQPALRAVDRCGLYAPDVVLVLLPETTERSAERLRESLRGKGVRVGAATAHGGTAGELVERARTSSTEREPVRQDEAGPVFRSPAMVQLVAQLRRVATSQLPILLRGETGSGKDVLATFVHQASGRGGPLRAINCGAIAPALLESTLFGHERGAFTGADRSMPGLFEQADGGTVFLDEVGELSPGAQAALLRVLETHRVQRLGSDREVSVDVRVVAATHVDLLEASRAGRFREDLFYRLEGFGVVVPPLRDRPEDVEPLAERFIQTANVRHGGGVTGMTPLAREVLRAYPFPGNVRELRNAIERAVVVAAGETIDVGDLPERMRDHAREGAARRPAGGAPPPNDAEASGAPVGDLRERVRAYERGLIERALSATGGNRAQAAEALGLPLRSLFYKLKELGITDR